MSHSRYDFPFLVSGLRHPVRCSGCVRLEYSKFMLSSILHSLPMCETWTNVSLPLATSRRSKLAFDTIYVMTEEICMHAEDRSCLTDSTRDSYYRSYICKINFVTSNRGCCYNSLSWKAWRSYASNRRWAWRGLFCCRRPKPFMHRLFQVKNVQRWHARLETFPTSGRVCVNHFGTRETGLG